MLVTKAPAVFRRGDIVELGFSVVAYRTHVKDNASHYICKLVTRTLTLLDDTVSKVSICKSFQSHIVVTKLDFNQQAHAMQMNAASSHAADSKKQSVSSQTGKRVRTDIVEYNDDKDVELTRKRFNRMRLISSDDKGTDEEGE